MDNLLAPLRRGFSFCSVSVDQSAAKPGPPRRLTGPALPAPGPLRGSIREVDSLYRLDPRVAALEDSMEFPNFMVPSLLNCIPLAARHYSPLNRGTGNCRSVEWLHRPSGLLADSALPSTQIAVRFFLILAGRTLDLSGARLSRVPAVFFTARPALGRHGFSGSCHADIGRHLPRMPGFGERETPRPSRMCFDRPTYHAFPQCERPAAFKNKDGFHASADPPSFFLIAR